MTILQADTKATAQKPRDLRAARDDARKAEDRTLPCAKPPEPDELESYNLPFTD